MSTALHSNETFPTDPLNGAPALPDYWNDASQPVPETKTVPSHSPFPSLPSGAVTVPAQIPRNRAGTGLPVLMAITDPVLAPEVTTVIAATGRGVIETADPRDIERLSSKVSAVLADATTAPVLASVPHGVGKVILFAEPGPVDFELAMSVHADHALVIPAQAPELLRIIGRADEDVHKGGERGRITAVIAAVGGAGGSTLSAALTMAQPGSTLIDAVPESGGLDLLLGVEESAGVRFNDVALGAGNIAATDLKNALPHLSGGQAVLTTARLSEDALHSDDIRAAVDLLATTGDVVIDCPYSGEHSNAALDVSDYAVVIVPSEIRAVARVKTLVERLRHMRVGCGVVVRHRGWSGLSSQEIENITGASVIAELPTVKKLAKTAEIHGLDGAIPVALKKCAHKVLEHAKVAGR